MATRDFVRSELRETLDQVLDRLQGIEDRLGQGADTKPGPDAAERGSDGDSPES